MNVLISGGTGFIGKKLSEKLLEEGHSVYIITRKPNKYENSAKKIYVDYHVSPKTLPKIDAVINLAGESLFGRWTKNKKASILQSRIETTRQMIALMERLPIKPEVFLSASAVGIYGTSENVTFTENSDNYGDDFLASVTAMWEEEANKAKKMGIRTVNARFGIVLDNKEGAMPLIALPVKLFVGGKIGSGNQWMPWIHVDDCIRLLMFALDIRIIDGPLNLTAPFPKRNRDFTAILSKTLRRPKMFTIPKNVIKFLLGEMSLLVTEGQFVYPEKALKNGFTFQFPHLEEALKNIFKK